MTNLYYVDELVVYITSKVGDSVIIEGNVLNDEETEKLWRTYGSMQPMHKA